MFNLGMGELIVILLIVLILFGASRVPEIARALGKAVTEFRKAGKEGQEGIDETVKEDDKSKEA